MRNWGSVHTGANHVLEAVSDRDSDPFLIWKCDFTLKFVNEKLFQTGFQIRLLKHEKGVFWIILQEVKNLIMGSLTCIGCDSPIRLKAYIAHSSGRSLMNLNLPFKLSLRWFEVVFWCLQWECCAFEKRLMKIHSNPQIIYYCFNY